VPNGQRLTHWQREENAKKCSQKMKYKKKCLSLHIINNILRERLTLKIKEQ
jgi:hypothetical protein